MIKMSRILWSSLGAFSTVVLTVSFALSVEPLEQFSRTQEPKHGQSYCIGPPNGSRSPGTLVNSWLDNSANCVKVPFGREDIALQYHQLDTLIQLINAINSLKAATEQSAVNNAELQEKNLNDIRSLIDQTFNSKLGSLKNELLARIDALPITLVTDAETYGILRDRIFTEIEDTFSVEKRP